MRKSIKFFIAFFILTLFFNFSCKQKQTTEEIKEKKSSVAFNVESEIAEYKTITEYLDYAGTVKSFNSLVVIPEVAGRISKMYKEAGDSVIKGDLLFEIEDTIYKAQYRQAKAALETAKIAYKDAKKNKNRTEAVYKKNGVSKTTYEQAVSAFERAKNAYEQAKAAFETAEFNYNSTDVKAEFSGVITSKNKEEGDFVNPSMSAGLGVYSLEDFEKIYVDINIASSEKVLLKKGQTAEIISSEHKIEGKVFSINEKTDPLSSSILVKIIAENKQKKILPGNIVTARIHYKTKENALVVPSSAVMDNNKLFIIKDNKAKQRTVKTGLENPNFVEILSGVEAGEKVIIKGNFGLFDNASVKEVSQ